MYLNSLFCWFLRSASFLVKVQGCNSVAWKTSCARYMGLWKVKRRGQISLVFLFVPKHSSEYMCGADYLPVKNVKVAWSGSFVFRFQISRSPFFPSTPHCALLIALWSLRSCLWVHVAISGERRLEWCLNNSCLLYGCLNCLNLWKNMGFGNVNTVFLDNFRSF